MIHNRFRVFHGPEGHDAPSENPASETGVRVALGDIFPLLAGALEDNRAWLKDFEDDEVTISDDLYEILMAYRYFNQTSA